MQNDASFLYNSGQCRASGTCCLSPGVEGETRLLAEPWCGSLHGKHKTQSSTWMKRGFSHIEKKQNKISFSCGCQCCTSSWFLLTADIGWVACTQPFCVTAEGPSTPPHRARYSHGVARCYRSPRVSRAEAHTLSPKRGKVFLRRWSFQPGLWGLFISWKGSIQAQGPFLCNHVEIKSSQAQDCLSQ